MHLIFILSKYCEQMNEFLQFVSPDHRMQTFLALNGILISSSVLLYFIFRLYENLTFIQYGILTQAVYEQHHLSLNFKVNTSKFR